MDKVTPRPLTAVASLIEKNSEEFQNSVLSRLFSISPQVVPNFPKPDDQTHISFSELLGAMLDGAGREGAVDEPTAKFFRELAPDYRRFGFTPSAFLRLGETICLELRSLCADLPFETVLFAERAVMATSRDMARSAQEADEAGQQAALDATVVEVEKRSRRFSVVRLQADGPLPYSPGQFVPVTANYLPNIWRFLCPSIPSNEWGQVEFHIQSDSDDVLRLLANSRPGDRWSIGAGRGDFGQAKKDSGNDLLFIAYGTGLAPLRAIMFELMNQANPPRMHFFVGAEYPGELYELMGLWNFAAACPWLSVVPVSLHESDAWWVQATEASRPPRGLHIPQVGSMAELVTSYGSWADRDVLIAGPEQMAKDTQRALIRRGAPRHRIEYLPY